MRILSVYGLYTVSESKEMTETSPTHSVKILIHPAATGLTVSLKTRVLIQFCDILDCPPSSLR